MSQSFPLWLSSLERNFIVAFCCCYKKHSSDEWQLWRECSNLQQEGGFLSQSFCYPSRSIFSHTHNLHRSILMKANPDPHHKDHRVHTLHKLPQRQHVHQSPRWVPFPHDTRHWPENKSVLFLTEGELRLKEQKNENLSRFVFARESSLFLPSSPFFPFSPLHPISLISLSLFPLAFCSLLSPSLSLSAPPPSLFLLSLSFYSIGLPGNLTETSLKSRPIEPRSQIAPRAHWIFLQMSNKRWTQLRFRETQKSILRLPPVTLRD